MDNYKVYIHLFPNGKRYIGITKQRLNKRWRRGNGYRKNSLVYKAINKYGWDNIQHILLLENLSKEQAENKEIELIATYKSNNPKYGYNIANGGNCVGTVSEETKKKQSISKMGPLNPMYGKVGPLNPTYGKKGRIPWNKGLKNVYTTKAKGIPLSEEHKEKLRQAKLNNPTRYWLGKKKDRKLVELQKLKTSYKVICLETNVIYSSYNEAFRQTKIHNIDRCCRKERKTAGGYHWEYIK